MSDEEVSEVVPSKDGSRDENGRLDHLRFRRKTYSRRQLRGTSTSQLPLRSLQRLPTMANLRTFSSALCHSCRGRLLPTAPAISPLTRAFGSTPPRQREDNDMSSLFGMGQSPARPSSAAPNTPSRLRRRSEPSSDPSQSISSILDADPDSFLTSDFHNNFSGSGMSDLPHKLHVYATKHNTHITLVQPARPASQTPSSAHSTSTSSVLQNKSIDVLLSLSAGNIGFRKAGRGSYDAGYQLGSFVLKQIQERGMLVGGAKLEVVLRGFGAGREAVTKCLLGAEGSRVRGRIVSVVDSTRLKQGGPRSKKPRRLG